MLTTQNDLQIHHQQEQQQTEQVPTEHDMPMILNCSASNHDSLKAINSTIRLEFRSLWNRLGANSGVAVATCLDEGSLIASTERSYAQAMHLITCGKL